MNKTLPVYMLVLGASLCASRSSAVADPLESDPMKAHSGETAPIENGLASHDLLGDDLITPRLVPYMTLHTFGEERLTWMSGGNHPNHKWMEIKIEDGIRIMRVHEDNTYGTSRTDYALDLDQGTIDVTMVRSPGHTLEETLLLPAHDSSVMTQLSYVGALEHMLAIVAKVAEGNDLGYVVLPPKPELSETQDFLKELLRQIIQ